MREKQQDYQGILQRAVAKHIPIIHPRSDDAFKLAKQVSRFAG
jgi:hypothetical protein